MFKNKNNTSLTALAGAHFGMKFILVPLRRAKQTKKKYVYWIDIYFA